MGTAQGKGEDCPRDAHASPQTPSPREVARPIACTAAVQGTGKRTASGRATHGREEQEPSYDTAWPVAPSPCRVETTREDFSGEETTASRRGEADSREPAAKEMPSLHGHGRLG